METSNLCYKTEHPDQNEKTNPIPSWGYNERLIGGDKPRGFRVNSGSNEGVEEHSYGIEEKITSWRTKSLHEVDLLVCQSPGWICLYIGLIIVKKGYQTSIE